MRDEGKVVQRMHLKRYLCTGLISSMMLVTSSLGIQAKGTSTLHIELTGGLGTAEIMTDEDITYPVDGGDDSFTFDKGTQLKITIHSKYGIDSVQDDSSVLKQKGKKIEKISAKDYTFIYKTQDMDTNLTVNLTEMHSRFKITSITTDENGEVMPGYVKYGCVKKSFYEEAGEDIDEAIELAQENGSESDYQILESDENGVFQTNDFLKGTYIIKKMGDESEPFELIVTRNKDIPYTYIRLNNGYEFSSDKTGTVKIIESNQTIQSATRIILKSKNDKLVEANGTFKIKMLNEKGKTLKNYKKQYLKTDKNECVRMYDGVRWMRTFTLKNGKSVLPVVLPDGNYKITKSKFNDCSLKTSDFTVSSNTISGLDFDSQPINDIVLQVKGN
jgi:archaellin